MLTFASFCCKPSAISPSAARIARARRGDSICAVGPPIGVGWKIQMFAFNTTHQQHRGTAHPWHSATSTSSLFFEVSDKGPRGDLVDLDEIYRSMLSDLRWALARKSRNSRQHHAPTAPRDRAPLALCHLDVLALFRGFSHRSKRRFGRSRRDLEICPGFRGIGHPASS